MVCVCVRAVMDIVFFVCIVGCNSLFNNFL